MAPKKVKPLWDRDTERWNEFRRQNESITLWGAGGHDYSHRNYAAKGWCSDRWDALPGCGWRLVDWHVRKKDGRKERIYWSAAVIRGPFVFPVGGYHVFFVAPTVLWSARSDSSPRNAYRGIIEPVRETIRIKQRRIEKREERDGSAPPIQYEVLEELEEALREAEGLSDGTIPQSLLPDTERYTTLDDPKVRLRDLVNLVRTWNDQECPHNIVAPGLAYTRKGDPICPR